MARVILRLLSCTVAGPVFLRLMASRHRRARAASAQTRNACAGWESHASRGAAVMVMDINKAAKFGIGQQVRHRLFPFRGIIYDVDPQFANTEEWWQSIPEEIRPVKNQPFYHLLAENDSSYYVAYVSEQNLLPDDEQEPVNHPQITEIFDVDDQGSYRIRTTA